MRLPLLGFSVLVAACFPSTASAQAVFVAPSGERPPVTRLPSCVAGRVVGACFDFESGNLDGWQLAQWTAESDGYVRGTIGLSSDYGSRSGRSLRIQAEFQSIGWSAIALELRADVSLADYAAIRAELFAPADSPLSLSVRFVIVAGPNWSWIETRQPLPLEPGTWSVVEVPLGLDAWRLPEYSEAVDERQWVAYVRDVHKIIVRLEAYPNGVGGHTTDSSLISVDNIWFPNRGGR